MSKMQLEWEITEPLTNPFQVFAGDHSEYVSHIANYSGADAKVSEAVVEAGLYALSLLAESKKEDSSCFLFVWDEINSSLSVAPANEDSELANIITLLTCHDMQEKIDTTSDDDASYEAMMLNIKYVMAGVKKFSKAVKSEELNGLPVGFCLKTEYDEVEYF